MNKVDVIERARLRKDIPPFRPGDQVKVHVKVREGTRERIQIFEGVVIGRRGGGLRESFTVRKISFGVGVERTFPVHAPVISKLEVVRHGRVRRAKLYYLRELSGKKAKIDERRTRIRTLEDVVVPEDGQAATAEELADIAPAEELADTEVVAGPGEPTAEAPQGEQAQAAAEDARQSEEPAKA